MRDHRRLNRVMVVVAAVLGTLAVVASVVVAVVAIVIDRAVTVDTVTDPEVLAFYDAPSGWEDAAPGELLRSAPLPGGPAAARAWRVLYRTEGASGEPRVSSGMVFAPEGATPPGGRPVVAWAHPTVGMGRSCTPSLRVDPIADMPWLEGMLSQGWVVTATDYAGLGTDGDLAYLISAAESYDVLNSVRMLDGLPEAGAGDRYALWGHSQGGHAVYAAAEVASGYLPDEELVAVAAAAPATALVPLVEAQWDTTIAWVLGSEVLQAWPQQYPALDVDAVTTEEGRDRARGLADRCIDAGAVEAELIDVFGGRLFSEDPMGEPAWREVAEENSPDGLPTDVPILIAQGLSDPVVLPPVQLGYVRGQCERGVALSQVWMGETGHTKAAWISGPIATTWLAGRFDGVPAGGDCAVALPPLRARSRG
ncbi:MAG: hypothetical protein IPM45_10945 [Acidimicrobiales bacterium]|nr:hypothetical protein [Acidimicrobiales bacterium]